MWERLYRVLQMKYGCLFFLARKSRIVLLVLPITFLCSLISSLLLFNIRNEIYRFNFERLWLHELEAEQLMSSAWIRLAGNPHPAFQQFLLSVRSALSTWHQAKFSPFPNKTKSASTSLFVKSAYYRFLFYLGSLCRA